MTKTWITRSGVALAGVALFAIAAGTANAAPGQGGCLKDLVAAGTITSAQAEAMHEAVESLRDSGVERREAHRQAVASLVADGTLTQAQADAIKTSKPAKRPGSRGSAPSTTAPSSAA
jgi:competence protein ComGC